MNDRREQNTPRDQLEEVDSYEIWSSWNGKFEGQRRFSKVLLPMFSFLPNKNDYYVVCLSLSNFI
jgi:hypothetical protein